MKLGAVFPQTEIAKAQDVATFARAAADDHVLGAVPRDPQRGFTDGRGDSRVRRRDLASDAPLDDCPTPRASAAPTLSPAILHTIRKLPLCANGANTGRDTGFRNRSMLTRGATPSSVAIAEEVSAQHDLVVRDFTDRRRTTPWKGGHDDLLPRGLDGLYGRCEIAIA